MRCSFLCSLIFNKTSNFAGHMGHSNFSLYSLDDSLVLQYFQCRLNCGKPAHSFPQFLHTSSFVLCSFLCAFTLNKLSNCAGQMKQGYFRQTHLDRTCSIRAHLHRVLCPGKLETHFWLYYPETRSFEWWVVEECCRHFRVEQVLTQKFDISVLLQYAPFHTT